MTRPKTGYTLDDCIKEAKKYSTKLEWQTASKSTYHKALNMGWIDKCCQHMPARSTKVKRSNAKNNKWSIEKAKEDAQNYATRLEWRKESPLAYDYAYRKGALDECSSHMTEPFSWTLDKLKEDAANYRSRTEWKTHSPNGYFAAYRKGMLDDCCAHMKKT